jgi:hypothetical protein
MTTTLTGMVWFFDSNSPRRDSSVPIEDELANVSAETQIPWRYKLGRVWRFLISR